MRWIRAAGGLLVTVAVVFGPPAVAVWWWQVAGLRWPTVRQLHGWVADPPDEAVLVLLVGVVGAALWLAVAVAACVSMAGQARRVWQRLRRMPVPTPAQATATSMAGAAVFGVPATTATAADVVPGMPEQPKPSAPHHTPADSAAREDPSVADDGVGLPDGSWLPAETAHAVTLAASLGWLRRRRDYQPPPPGADGADDTPELPSTVAAIQAQTPATDPDTGTGLPGRGAVAPLVPSELPTGGVGLTGEGADDAARGVLVTALLSPAVLHVVTTRHDMHRLLGDFEAAVEGLPGLHVADDLAAALSVVSAAETQPRMALVTHVPTVENDVAHLRAMLAQGPAGAVLLGHWPHGPTRRINPDGTTTTDTGTQRWCVLSIRTATDLCLLAGHAHGTRTAPPAPSPASPATVDTQAWASGRTQSPELKLTLLGPPALTFDGTPVHLRRAAALHAVVLLAVHHDGRTTRQLSEALWPAEPARATTNRVYTTLSDLRRTLTTHTGVPVIHRDADRYHLDTGHIDVDLRRLQHAIGSMIALPPGSEEHATACWRVTGLYTGEIAAGRTWPWLEPHRERLRRHILSAYTVLTEHAAPADKLAILQKAVEADPHNEEMLRRAITALAHSGEHARIAELIGTHRSGLAQRGLTPSAHFDSFVADATASAAQRCG